MHYLVFTRTIYQSVLTLLCALPNITLAANPNAPPPEVEATDTYLEDIPEPILSLLSGDLSFSYEPIEAVYQYWVHHFKKRLKEYHGKRWMLVMVREENFDKGE